MDLTESIQPSSDQIDAIEFLTGPRTVTITGIRAGSAEQPVQLDLAEFDRPFRPSKTVRRILVAAWGADGNQYIGRRMTLFRDPKVVYGGIAVGGIRVSHLSHIDAQMSIVLAISRGKTGTFKIDPLPDEQPQDKPLTVQDCMHDLDLDADAMKALSARVLGHEISGWNDLKPEEQQLIMSALADWMDTGVDPTIEQEEK